MAKYAAFLRGIGPLNPNMRNQKLREVFEGLGFSNVQTVISSGNVLFESTKSDTPALEAQIEQALYTKLGFQSTTIIRSDKQLQRLAKKDPFKGLEHGQKAYLLVTFLKKAPPGKALSPNDDSKVLGMYDNAIFTVTDTTQNKTPNLMVALERQFGKQITSRTWRTIERVLAKIV